MITAHAAFLFDLAITVLTARCVGAATTRIGQPAVVGEIFAGILLGPTVTLSRRTPAAQVTRRPA